MILQEKKSYELVEKGIDKLVEISKKIGDNDSDEKKDVYLKLQNNLKKLYKDALDYEVEESLKQKLKNTIESFTSAQKFSQELKDKGFVKDERFR